MNMNNSSLYYKLGSDIDFSRITSSKYGIYYNKRRIKNEFKIMGTLWIMYS